MAEQPTNNISIRIFGGVGVEHEGTPLSIGGPRQQRLLALLALRAGSAVSIDWLAEHLWDDDDRPEATAPALRTYFSRLRRSLPAPADQWVQTIASGYRLDAPAQAIEHLRVRQLRAEARRARELDDPSSAHAALTEALDTYRGEPFRELENVDLARSEIEQLHLERLEMLEERWEVDLALGRHTQITGELAVFADEHGLRDRAAQQYALALHRSNRTAEALQVVADFRTRLADQTGLEPSSSMVEFERALLADDPALAAPAAGRPLRGYRLLEEAGLGAFSVVWRAEQPSVQRTVAIKQIRRELAHQPEFIRRFEIEAHLVARLEHPHVVPLIDFWRDPDSAYLVMRWLSGGTLEQRLDDRSLSVPETIELASQIGGALSAAHASGVIHRDVKTANILFDEAQRAFLTDFGIALPTDATTGPDAALSPGSPAYASPEQIRREPLGPQADIFSLGVVLFECLTGTLPFNDAGRGKLVEQQLDVEFPTLNKLRADVPRHVSDAIATATAKRPGDRFESIDAFLDALTNEPGSAPGVRESRMSGEAMENPYLGLRAFDGADHRRFFGRDRLVRQMTDRLAPVHGRAANDEAHLASRALVVVGPSGSGKSSVVRAGLLPALRNGAVDGASDWFTTTMVPGRHPFDALEAALLRVAVNPPPSLLDQLQSGPRGILRAVRRCIDADAGARLLLVVDQFEEIFLGADDEEADAFLHALAVAVEEPSSPLRLVATLRADFYHRPLQHRAFAHVLNHCAVDVTPLAADELEEAITRPAELVGATFEPGLVARISAETLGQPSPLPLLQHLLRELFDDRSGSVLTIAAYEEKEGLTGSLARRAEEMYDASSDAERNAIRRLMGQLIDPASTAADNRRRVYRSDLGTESAVEEALHAFIDARLLSTDRDPFSREPTVEVAHEALLREWPRLERWLEEDRDLLRSADAVGFAASAWVDGGRRRTDLYRGDRLASAAALAADHPDRFRPIDHAFLDASSADQRDVAAAEAQRLRRLRTILAGTVAALLIALVAGGIAFWQFRRADSEAQRAQLEADVALEANRAAEFATLVSRSASAGLDDPEVGLLLALEARERAQNPDEQAAADGALLDRLGTASLATTVASFEQLAVASCALTVVNSDGTAEFVTIDGELVQRDALSGDVTTHGPAPLPCVEWMGDPVVDRSLAVSPDGLTFWAGTFDGPLEAERTFDEPTSVFKRSFRPTGRIPVVTRSDEGVFLSLLDDLTLESVGTPLSGGENVFNAEVNDSGSLVAFSFGTFDREGGDGETLVIDGVTGEEIVRVRTPLPLDNLFFDDDARQLLGTSIDARLLTADLDTGEIVADVPMGGVGRVFDMAIDENGLVRLLASGRVVSVDRSSGPTGSVIELGNINGGRFRADGMILGFGPNGSTDVIEPDGNALVATRHDAQLFGYVDIADGRAVSVSPGSEPTELIDLATGERMTLEFARPDGGEERPILVHTMSDAIWTFGQDFEVTQWVDGAPAGSLAVPDVGFAGNVRDRQWPFVLGERGGDDAEVLLIDLGSNGPKTRFSIPVMGAINAHVSNDRGLHVIDVDGVLTTFDEDGNEIDRIDTGLGPADVVVADPSSSRVAVAKSFDAGVAIIDRASGAVERIAETDTIVNLAFVRNGEYLVLTSLDGSVRLWNVERGELAGLVFDGTGARTGGSSWYDPASDSMWVSTSGSVIEVPLDPEVWVQRACIAVGRELTDDERDRFVPGDAQPSSPCVS